MLDAAARIILAAIARDHFVRANYSRCYASQSTRIVGRETIYRNRNTVQTNLAASDF